MLSFSPHRKLQFRYYYIFFSKKRKIRDKKDEITGPGHRVCKCHDIYLYSYLLAKTMLFFTRPSIFLILIAMEEDKLQNMMNESSFLHLVIYCKSVWLKSTTISTVQVRCEQVHGRKRVSVSFGE